LHYTTVTSALRNRTRILSLLTTIYLYVILLLAALLLNCNRQLFQQCPVQNSEPLNFCFSFFSSFPRARRPAARRRRSRAASSAAPALPPRPRPPRTLPSTRAPTGRRARSAAMAGAVSGRRASGTRRRGGQSPAARRRRRSRPIRSRCCKHAPTTFGAPTARAPCSARALTVRGRGGRRGKGPACPHITSPPPLPCAPGMVLGCTHAKTGKRCKGLKCARRGNGGYGALVLFRPLLHVCMRATFSSALTCVHPCHLFLYVGARGHRSPLLFPLVA